MIEFQNADALRRHLADHGTLLDVVIQNVDLTSLDAELRRVPATGAFFLGCHLTPNALDHIVDTGGIVFPRLPALPYRPYRATLYAPSELMEGYVPGKLGSFLHDTLDGRIYRHFAQYRGPESSPPIIEALAQRIHDHAIDDALRELLASRPKVVGIMGGHAMKRDEAAYRDIVSLGRRLTRADYFVATGGGPGAMEAGNLGAYLAPREADEVERAVDLLQQETDFLADRYVELSCELLQRYPAGGESLAIPTWFYGHEPTNQFTPYIAKYFANSIREDGLLAICRHGVVYTPGSAGTFQEVFQDAAQNQYGLFHWISPMVFYGRKFWTETAPIFRLLEKIAAPHVYAKLLLITDDVEEIVEFLASHPPLPYPPQS